jgi:cysteinyl-tRNA synthetase
VTGKTFVRFWVHGEHLLADGEKMSKSKGNFYTLRDLIERGYDPLTIRYLLVSVPYRKQLNFTLKGLTQAQQALDRIKEFLFQLKSTALPSGANPELSEAVARARAEFEAGLDDDLNTAQALAAVFDLIAEGNVALRDGRLREENRQEILHWFADVDNRLAIVPRVEELVQHDEEIDGLIARRNEARRNRDFAQSDLIRRQLLDRGIIIEDSREGTKWRRR